MAHAAAATQTAPIPPQNLDAEESVLGAMMLSPGAIGAVSEVLSASDFYRESHAKIYRAGLALYAKGEPVDAITLVDELERRGELEDVGGRVRIHELAALVPAASNAAHYARIVREKARDRQLIEQLRPLWEGLRNGGVEASAALGALEAARGLLESPAPEPARRATDGREFVHAVPPVVPALWGTGSQVIWAEGEALMLVGPEGVGKGTVAQQLLLGRIGLRRDLLGLPIAEASGPVLYLAMDRPRQVASSLRRMVSPTDDDALAKRLRVWRGPVPVDVVREPRSLADWIGSEFGDVSDVFADSLKDLAPKLSDDETGGKVNAARQELLVRGLQVCELHHQRKEQQGAGKPKSLADVYGSRWLTAGVGSVVLLWGEPGDAIVELIHLKQPAEAFGPLKLYHDHERGVTAVHHQVDLEKLLARSDGLTVAEAARQLFDTDGKPSPNQIEKARRRLEALVGNGRAERRDDADGTGRYVAREAGA